MTPLRLPSVFVSILLLIIVSGCPAPNEGTQPGDCIDEVDNDGDGLFDCADAGCAGSPMCAGGDDDDDTTDDDAYTFGEFAFIDLGNDTYNAASDPVIVNVALVDGFTAGTPLTSSPRVAARMPTTQTAPEPSRLRVAGTPPIDGTEKR